jgi:hypothetical protein
MTPGFTSRPNLSESSRQAIARSFGEQTPFHAVPIRATSRNGERHIEPSRTGKEAGAGKRYGLAPFNTALFPFLEILGELHVIGLP